MAPPSEPGGARAADAGNGSGATYGMADLVASSGVPAATIRHYLSLGLLPPPRRQSAHRFVYDRRHLEALSVIRSLRERRQLPLDVIRQMLPQLMADLDEAFPAAAWEQAVELHLGEAQDQGPAGRLLEAAIGAFTARGYADVTVDDLCAAVGLAKGSFYRYYPSKEELFFAVVETLGRRTVAALEEAAADAGGFLDDSTAAAIVS
ncbi:MAG TPA: TetR family transcriptional regulator, partial [Acidimicrobiales bacterium]|nr:TetR family transcriptional regulator [Acidimicrobiales bacterium]